MIDRCCPNEVIRNDGIDPDMRFNVNLLSSLGMKNADGQQIRSLLFY
jgi:hypothetical protein